MHLSSARDQPRPPEQQRWVTPAALTQPPPAPGSPSCCDSSTRSPEPPLTNLLSRLSLGWLHSFWAQIWTKGLWLCPIQSRGTWRQNTGTSAGAAQRATVCPLAGLGLSVHWEGNKGRTSLLRFGRWVSSVSSIK